MSGRRAKRSPATETSSNAQTLPLNSHKIIEIKSKFDAEFRRFSVDLDTTTKADSFYELVSELHKLKDIPFLVTYSDKDGDQLPINNDDNYMKALSAVKGLLRLQIQRKGETPECGFGTLKKKKRPISMFMAQESTSPRKALPISFPEDFRQVSSIIDVDIVPQTHRRVRLIKNGQEKPLGFYIRDGVSVRVTPHGLEKVPGIFISRLVPGGLAESTGLLAINDEVLEVNGIEVTGKSLDQVTDMMVANSSNLIITVKPINEANTLAKPSRAPNKITGPMNKHSRTKSDQGTPRLPPDVIGNHKRTHSNQSDEVRDMMRDDDDDEVTDHTQESLDKLSITQSSQSDAQQSGSASGKPTDDADDDDDSMTL